MGETKNGEERGREERQGERKAEGCCVPASPWPQEEGCGTAPCSLSGVAMETECWPPHD